MMTSESLSVVMSVENAQGWLHRDLYNLIDCLADLTSRFEIIVIDNASRDDTIEVLEDFRARFPQLIYRRLATPQLIEEAARVGMAMATGELVFSPQPGGRIDPNELRRLWELRVDPRLLVARSQTTARRVDAGILQRLTQWAQRVTQQSEPSPLPSESFGGLQMLRRRAVQLLEPALSGRGHSAAPEPRRDSQIEVSHLSHQQLASPKLVEGRREKAAGAGGLVADAIKGA